MVIIIQYYLYKFIEKNNILKKLNYQTYDTMHLFHFKHLLAASSPSVFITWKYFELNSLILSSEIKLMQH